MKWEVRGADRESGRDVIKMYRANSEEAASLRAKDDGILVESISLLFDADADPSAALSAPPTNLDYRRPHTHSGPIPTYGGLTIAGGVLRIYAVICYVCGGLVLFFAVVGIVGMFASGRFTSIADAVPVAMAIAPALAFLFAAAVSHGLGSACYALRDIAKNSWR